MERHSYMPTLLCNLPPLPTVTDSSTRVPTPASTAVRKCSGFRGLPIGLVKSTWTRSRGLSFHVSWQQNMAVKRLFTRKEAADSHAEFHTHPTLCLRLGCTLRFETVEDCWAHENKPDYVSTSKLFLCTVPMYRRVVSSRPLEKKSVRRHIEIHVSHGHMQDHAQHLPRQVDETFRQSMHCHRRSRDHLHPVQHRGQLGDTGLQATWPCPRIT